MRAETQKMSRMSSFLCAAFAVGALVLFTSSTTPAKAASTDTIFYHQSGNVVQNSYARTPALCTDENDCLFNRWNFYATTTSKIVNRIGLKVGAWVTALSASGTIQQDGGGTRHFENCTGGSTDITAPALMLCDLDTEWELTYGSNYLVYLQAGPTAGGAKQATSIGANAWHALSTSYPVTSFPDDYGGAGCNASPNGCDGTVGLYFYTPDPPPSTGPEVDWYSWPDESENLLNYTLNQTMWQIRTNTTTPVDFDLGIYREGVLSFATTTLSSNWTLGCISGVGSCTAYRGPPMYSHTTGTYELLVRGQSSSGYGDFDHTDYTVISEGSLPETCEGGFFTSCFWTSLMYRLFVPSASSAIYENWAGLENSMQNTVPFGWWYRIKNGMEGVSQGATTSFGYTFSWDPDTTSSTNPNIVMPIDFAPTSTHGIASAYSTYVRPMLVVMAWLGLIGYLWTRLPRAAENTV